MVDTGAINESQLYATLTFTHLNREKDLRSSVTDMKTTTPHSLV